MNGSFVELCNEFERVVSRIVWLELLQETPAPVLDPELETKLAALRERRDALKVQLKQGLTHHGT